MMSAAVPPPRSCDLLALPPYIELLPPLTLLELSDAAAATVLVPDTSAAAIDATSAAADTATDMAPTALCAFGCVYKVAGMNTILLIYCYLSCTNYYCSFCSGWKTKEK